MSVIGNYVSVGRNSSGNIEGLDKSNCCSSLMCDGFGFFCEEYYENIWDNDDAIKYCQFYYRDHNCWIELRREAEAEKAEKEKIAREKAEAKEKALIEKVLAECNQSIKRNPNDAEAFRLRGGAYAQKKDYTKAIDDFDKAIKIDPDNAESYAFRGAAYSEKQEQDKAMLDFNEAIRLNPKCKNAYMFRAALYGVKGEHDKSISDYEEALRIDPNDKTTMNLLGNARGFKVEAERKRKEEMKVKVRKIGRVFAVLLAVLSIIIGIVYNITRYPVDIRNPYIRYPDIGDFIFFAASFTIFFLIIFLCMGWVKKSISLCAVVLFSYVFVDSYSTEWPFIIVLCSYIISCITAMIFPRD